MRDLERNIAGIGVLADPVRRELYQYVCFQREPVGRDQAARAVGIARHQAKFHLDRLEAEGLLQADYVRLTGRTGPGAGRPAKRYRRADGEFAVTLPPREYQVVAQILAEAVAASAQDGTPDYGHAQRSRRSARSNHRHRHRSSGLGRYRPWTSSSASSAGTATNRVGSARPSSWPTVRIAPSPAPTPNWSAG